MGARHFSGPTATCDNCSQPIRQSAAGWVHVETSLPRCAMEFFAVPQRGRHD